MSSCQPIDTAPKDGTECVFYSPKHGRVVGRIPEHMAHYKKPEAVVKSLFRRNAQAFRPTHWMTLPEPPTGGRMMGAMDFGTEPPSTFVAPAHVVTGGRMDE